MIAETLSCSKLCGMTVILAEHSHHWISLPVNVGVWWWCTETTSLRERVQRVPEWVGIHHEDYTFQPGRSRTCEYSASSGTSFGIPSRHNSKFIHCTGVICENCSQHYPCTTGIQQCVCMVDTRKCDESSQKLMFAGAFSLLHSFKGGTNGFLESMVTLWDMGSPFYSNSSNAVDIPIFIQNHKISVPVCWKAVSSLFCAAGVIRIVFMLWDPKANVNICCADCIRLLAEAWTSVMRYDPWPQ